MKILLIDDCEITLESIHLFLDQEIPGVEVTQYPSLRLHGGTIAAMAGNF